MKICQRELHKNIRTAKISARLEKIKIYSENPRDY